MTDNIFDRMLGVLWDAERSNLPHQKWELSPQAWTELCADTRWFACWNAPNDLAFGLPILITNDLDPAIKFRLL